MANARTRFDNIRDELARTHEASIGQYAGKPCAQLGHLPIVTFVQGAMAFRLHGRAHAAALALAGAQTWHPLGTPRPGDEWVLVGPGHMLRWERLAIEAVRCAREYETRGAQAAAPAAPPPDPEQREQHTRTLGERFASLSSDASTPLKLTR